MIAAKNTIFSTKTTLNCSGRLLDLSRPVVMGIINVTPDSFYNGGALKNEADLLRLAEKMLADGATILDIGGMSARPGSEFIAEDEEMQRVLPAIDSIKKHLNDPVISIDTWRSEVARQAVLHGASIVNDISAGTLDKNLWSTVAALKVPYILMHMQGTPGNMQLNPVYDDVVKEVFDFFKEKVFQLNALGIFDIVIDCGFGFGKSVEHNYRLLQNLETFRIFGLPLMAGLSRKSMVCKILNVNPDKALNGTTVLNSIALMKGANIIRVHDVKEAIEAIQLTDELKNVTV
jgi:dihydropteroate synthase